MLQNECRNTLTHQQAVDAMVRKRSKIYNNLFRGNFKDSNGKQRREICLLFSSSRVISFAALEMIANELCHNLVQYEYSSNSRPKLWLKLNALFFNSDWNCLKMSLRY